MEEKKVKKHFVLVHGITLGAWCWYKVTTQLEAAGHRVTAIDLAGSGVNTTSMDDLSNFADYVKPLTDVMAMLADDEKVVLVGHSLGGICISLAMEMFPEKIETAVFVTAFLPNCSTAPSLTIQEYYLRNEAEPMDSEVKILKNGDIRVIIGPKHAASYLMNCTSVEDQTLSMALSRVGVMLLEDLSKLDPFSSQRFGSVTKFFVVCQDDKTLTEDFQRWMIENSCVNGVMEIERADHAPMLSQPNQLCKYLLQI